MRSIIIQSLLCFLARSLCQASTKWLVDNKGFHFTSASTIASSNISTICPTIDANKIPFATPQELLTQLSALGYMGPLGPEGPLGLLGPLNNVFGASQWTALMQQWFQYSQNIGDLRGPLGPEGPLGYQGPCSEQQYYGTLDPGKNLFENNDFEVQSRNFGLWSALGVTGPLGPLGALGPLGPLGAHGYSTDIYGNYLNNHSIVYNVTIQYDNHNNKRTYPLFEYYLDEEYTKNYARLDTSFLVQGSCQSLQEVDSYTIIIQDLEIVTIVLIPLTIYDDFDLHIYNDQGQLMAASSTYGYIETIQLSVKPKQQLQISVTLISTLDMFGASYRLSVTGSTSNLNKYNILGDHVRSAYMWDSIGSTQ